MTFIAGFTHSSWHSTIRLCKNDNQGFFERAKGTGATTPASAITRTLWYRRGNLVHEISHNINAIGDKVSAEGVGLDGKAKNLAGQSAHKASWNAANYQWYAQSL